MIALYPGTFDPITNGHFEIIRRASTIFQVLVVGVAVSDEKTPIFEICNDCGIVKEHLDENLTKNINDLSKKTGFTPNNPVLEIHGRCGECTSDISQ